MSFHADLLVQLEADAATALAFGAAQVYSGRRAQKVQNVAGEVWIEPVEVRSAVRGGGSQDQGHEYRVHVRVRGKQEGNLTGAIQQAAVKAHLETLRRRWDGARTLNAGVLAELIALQVEEDRPDALPDDLEALDGSLRLVAWER